MNFPDSGRQFIECLNKKECLQLPTINLNHDMSLELCKVTSKNTLQYHLKFIDPFAER